MSGRYTADGFVVFADHPCRTGCDHDQAYKPAEIDRLRLNGKRRARRAFKALDHELFQALCPGERCLTLTPGGRICHFCRRTV
jgi:hypothetical protein